MEDDKKPWKSFNSECGVHRFILWNVLTSCSVENVLETVKIRGGGSSLENRWLEKDHESEAGQRQWGWSDVDRLEGNLGSRINRCGWLNVKDEWQGFVKNDTQKSESLQNMSITIIKTAKVRKRQFRKKYKWEHERRCMRNVQYQLYREKCKF